MRIALGADHAGVHLKQEIRQLLDERGIAYTDFGTNAIDSVDYPDFAVQVAKEVASGHVEYGILFCGSGIGMAMAANKIAGVRAASVTDEMSARLSREHNNANILALGERITPAPLARQIVNTFLDTPFAGGRHQRRLDKIAALEHPPA
jgi:ribose 5-phosphate isomerase B